MSAVALAEKRSLMNREEYLAFERTSSEKHEFHDGEVFAMAGARRRHNQLGARLGGLLDAALRGRPCEVYSSDMKVRIPNRDRYMYPDVSVACGEPLFEDEEELVLLNPLLICEVLSPTTQSYDRGDKFADYRTIPSLREYVLVAPQENRVEHHAWQPGGAWLLRELRQPGDVLVLSALGVEFPLSEIYAGILPAA